MMEARRDYLVGHYALKHRDPRNELIHCICVPAILFAALGLLYAISTGFALLGIAAAMLYYLRLGARTATQMGVVLIVMLLAWMFVLPSHHVVAFALGIFILGWIGQFIGHGYEGAKPSFTEDVQYLLVGPVFVLDVLGRRLVDLLRPR